MGTPQLPSTEAGAMLLLSILASTTLVMADNNNTRVEKALSVFTVVKFPNSACTSSTAGRNGTCYTSSECSANSGTASGTSLLRAGPRKSRVTSLYSPSRVKLCSQSWEGQGDEDGDDLGAEVGILLQPTESITRQGIHYSSNKLLGHQLVNTCLDTTGTLLTCYLSQ